MEPALPTAQGAPLMAEVRLGRYEAREGLLPPVCMVCGAPAGVVRTMWFWLVPWWLYLVFPLGCGVLYLVLLLLLVKRARVQAPLCALHRNHWHGRFLILVGMLALMTLVVGAGLALQWMPFDPPKTQLDVDRQARIQHFAKI